METLEKPVAAAAGSSTGRVRRAWLSPTLCRGVFGILLLWGAYSHIGYVHHSPLDLSGDEAQYWDWSRQLGLSYYSKGPLVAYIIRASCAIFGNTMPGVRYPAILLATLTAICSYWLVVKLFGSDRLALGAALLSACVPVFLAGSILMTIDPPFYFCWALATCLAVKGLFDGSRWVWPVVGIVLGMGFLAKYAMFLWLVGLAVYLWMDRPSRRWLRSGWFWAMLPIALAFTAPVVIWNVQHGWASFQHVKEQTGTGFELKSPFEFLGGQIALLGPSLFIILVGGVVYLWRRESWCDPNRRALLYLGAIGLSFFAIVSADSLRSKVQPNWPAPAYFTLLILGVYFLSIRLGRGAPWRWWWRGNLAAVVIGGIVLMPLVHDFSVVYPYLPAINRLLAHVGVRQPKTPRSIDPTYKLRGWAELGQTVGQQRHEMGTHPFVMGEDYQTTAELAFYVPGQPKTYYASSYFALEPGRLCQYDMWSDRALDPARTKLIGRDAVYVGYMRQQLAAAFDRIERMPDVVIERHATEVRRFLVWRCYGFKGLPRAVAHAAY